jgi:hypothetical protein
MVTPSDETAVSGPHDGGSSQAQPADEWDDAPTVDHASQGAGPQGNPGDAGPSAPEAPQDPAVASVGRIRERLAELDQLPVDQHVEVYEDLHAQLTAALRAVDSATSPRQGG